MMLLMCITAVIAVTTWGLMTSKVTEEELNEMLNDEEMWP